VETFVDGIMAAQRESLHTAGAVVVIVSDGKLYFSKGYGYADMAKSRAVDPEKTLFRIGSVSKLFTWTAVMQMAEQKKLDLTTDVNNYLSTFKIPETYSTPITLSHLLAHTAGFEDRVIGLFSHDPAALKPLRERLAGELPQRVRPPGRIAVYSNHGAALAGLIVQEVSAMPWEDFVEKNILEPLQIKHTTVRQPVPVSLKGDLAVGYKYVQGDFMATGFEYVPLAPAGCMSASGGDMARFMIAHLQNGRYEDTRILSEDTARLMHSTLFSNAPGINAMLHGFYEMNQNGERIFGHGGDITCYHTLLALLPERNIGVFVSYNSDTGAKAAHDFWQAFLDRYFPPVAVEDSKPAAASAVKLAKFAGEYSSLRRSFTTLTKLSDVMNLVKVRVDPEGYLVTTGLGGETRRWIEVEPSVFREARGTRRLAFKTEDSGRAAYLFPDFPAIALVKHQWHETFLFHAALAGVSLLLMISALVFWPVVAYCSSGKPRHGSPPRTARLSAWLMSLLFVVFFMYLLQVTRDPGEIAFGIPILLQRALWLPIGAALFVVLNGVFMVVAWLGGYWSFLGRVHYTLVTFAGAALLWWTYHWNLLGFHY
jgi:CubicO group peptidase (beta-lactamase class C family)